MRNTSETQRIDTDRRTAEARCAHHDLYGNVCDKCFAVTPDLVECAGRIYRLPAWQIAEEMAEDPALYDRVSPLTVLPISVDATDVKVGDRIALRTPSLVVARIESQGPAGIDFTDAKGKRYSINDPSIPVLR